MCLTFQIPEQTSWAAREALLLARGSAFCLHKLNSVWPRGERRASRAPRAGVPLCFRSWDLLWFWCNGPDLNWKGGKTSEGQWAFVNLSVFALEEGIIVKAILGRGKTLKRGTRVRWRGSHHLLDTGVHFRRCFIWLCWDYRTALQPAVPFYLIWFLAN